VFRVFPRVVVDREDVHPVVTLLCLFRRGRSATYRKTTRTVTQIAGSVGKKTAAEGSGRAFDILMIWRKHTRMATSTGECSLALEGERTSADGKSVKNHLLLSIGEDEFSRFRPHLRYVDLPHHASLHEPNQKLDFVFFPNKGLVSLVVATREGKTVEVGVVGREGLVGIPAAVGLNRSPHRAVVQIEGTASKMAVTALTAVLPSVTQFQVLANRYAVVQGMQAAQTAACNRLHGIEQRLARWLLIMQDRVDSGVLLITHDFLATMLGTDRPSVSVAAGSLQRKELIACTRGAVRVLKRKGLETAACECYSVVQQFNGAVGIK